MGDIDENQSGNSAGLPAQMPQLPRAPAKVRLELEKIDGMPNLRIGTRKDGKSYVVRDNRDRFFYPKEWKRFSDALKESQRFTFDFLMNTGSRIKEAQHVTVGDIDLDNKRLILRVTKTKSKKRESNPRPRTIPFSTSFARVLRKEIKDRQLQNSDKLGILSTPAAHLAMKAALKKAGIKDWYMFSIHNVRKTLETWLIAHNVNEVKISRHMGHDITTAIQHYVSPDVFSWHEKTEMREIIGDLYQQ
jgi:integrase